MPHRACGRHTVRACARQPPLAPLGDEAAPGVLAPMSAPLPAVPLLGAVDGAGDMPPVALWPELVSPVSDFF
ncbi:hypothetical protein NUV25_18475 [Burkholderia pseudomultivorans]|uniref:hypothetical protein n=1 Tax=Burkholderia pseudomultivorans TaxID=1207504 RepID=UPI000AA80A5E|nr:hypothetical protein [Burkholderia pseudomultivorans]MDS0859695.1 hypothetical protein [Burkholderia pseudomultivorans]